MDFLREVTATIKRYHLLANSDRVLIAVSGGPDSMALLHVLCDLREELGLRLEVAHLQHGIRGEEAREDAQFVAAAADKFKLPFHLKEINLPEIKSNAGKGNMEALAREERYSFFAAVACERNISKVATAHTQDDQAETVLMWFLRGAGRKGMGGMSALSSLKPRLTVIRPLLNISKAEILQFLKQKQIAHRFDQTNQDTQLLRNWIRLTLIPQLKERIDSRLPLRLAKQSQILRDEDAVLENLAQVELEKIRSAKGLQRDLFLKQSKAMQRRILRRWIEVGRGHLRGLDFTHIEELLVLIAEGPPQGRLAIPGALELVKEYETLRLEKHSRSVNRICYAYELRIGDKLDVGEAGMTIHSKRIAHPFSKRPDNLFQAVFDIALLPDKLTVRNFRNGDRFRPLGMAGHKKVKELFIEKKTPRSIRSKLPLLTMGEEILWIPGYGRSEFGRIGRETKEVLHVTVVTWEP
jgi:tRNA(Ile)-lysidine synthase